MKLKLILSENSNVPTITQADNKRGNMSTKEYITDLIWDLIEFTLMLLPILIGVTALYS